jgi:hypothetical protein
LALSDLRKSTLLRIACNVSAHLLPRCRDKASRPCIRRQLRVPVKSVKVNAQSLRPVLGLALIVGGALVIGGIGITSTSSRQSIGHLSFLGAACLWAYYTVAVRRARIDGLHAAAIAAVASLLCYLPIYLLLCGDRLLQVPLIDIIVQAFYQGVLTAVISLAL